MNDLWRCIRAGAASLVACLLLLAPAVAADKVRLSLADKSDPAYLPFFVAIDKGYYRDLGLDVSILYMGAASRFRR